MSILRRLLRNSVYHPVEGVTRRCIYNTLVVTIIYTYIHILLLYEQLNVGKTPY